MVCLRDFAAKAGFSDSHACLNEILHHFGVKCLSAAVAASEIAEFHRRTGANDGPLGAPKGGLVRQSDGAYSQSFQFSTVLRPLDGPITADSRFLARVRVAALRCFGTEDPGGEDEPYIILTLYSFDPTQNAEQQVKSILLGPESGVNSSSKNVVFEAREIGEAFVTGRGFRIRADLWEHESGSPEEVRNDVEDKVIAGVRVGLSKLADVIGLGAAGEALAGVFADVVGKGITAAIVGIFGDDHIATIDFPVSGKFLEQVASGDGLSKSLITAEPELPKRIFFNFPQDHREKNWLFEGGGGSYKAYFSISAVGVPLPILP